MKRLAPRILPCILLCVCSFLLSGCGTDLKLAKQAYKNGDYDTAIAQWNTLSDIGIPQAHLELAKLYARGRGGLQRDLRKSLSLLDQALLENDPTNDPSLSRAILRTKLIIGSELLKEKNTAHIHLGKSYLEDAIETGDPKAFFELARMYEEGYGVSKNGSKAVELYRKSASMGYERALYYQGRIFYRGRLVGQNYKRALELYSKAYAQGYLKASVDIGRIYEKGYGVPIDIQKAKYYYEIASNNGVERATKYLNKLKQKHGH